MFDVTGSIVLYRTSAAVVKKVIDSFLNTKLNVRLYLIDHSPVDSLKFLSNNDRVEYIFNPLNPGFGAGHNAAIRKVSEKSKFHAVINPDIYYHTGVIESILYLMEQYPKIGAVMPKILYPDGRIQYMAKLLPTPLDFIIRRFIPFNTIRSRIDNRFELKESGYNKLFNVPFLSGCFIIFRTEILLQIGAFDENIFMYTEDIDICRRVINCGYSCMFFPGVAVYHNHEKKSFANLKVFAIYLKSAIYYFNKWGWFFDRSRKEINQNTLRQFNSLKNT